MEFKPCPFCKTEGGYKILEKVSGNLGFLGKIDAGIALLNCKGFNAKLEVYISHEPEEGNGGSVSEAGIEIQYCPFCGRRLRAGDGY